MTKARPAFAPVWPFLGSQTSLRRKSPLSQCDHHDNDRLHHKSLSQHDIINNQRNPTPVCVKFFSIRSVFAHPRGWIPLWWWESVGLNPETAHGGAGGRSSRDGKICQAYPCHREGVYYTGGKCFESIVRGLDL